MRPGNGTVEERASILCSQDFVADQMHSLGYMRDQDGQWVMATDGISDSPITRPLSVPHDWPGTTNYIRRKGRPRSKRGHAVEPTAVTVETTE